MPGEARWLRLIQACLRDEGSNPASRFLQLATLTSEGEVSCRTVVFRGWHDLNSKSNPEEKLHGLKIITDSRSEKMEGLRRHPWAEACWYFLEARQQYRLTGKVIIVDADESDEALAQTRVEQWQALSSSARLQFRFPVPGEKRGLSTDGTDPFNPPPPSSSIPETTFVLLLLEATKVDCVDLRATERTIFQYRDTLWHETSVNP